MNQIDRSNWTVKDAQAQLKRVRGYTARREYPIYVRGFSDDLVPVLGFILDKLEELEEKKPNLVLSEEYSLINAGVLKIRNGEVVL